MKCVNPIFESSYVFLNLFALVMLTSLLPFILVEVNVINVLIVISIVFLLIYFYAKFLLHRVKLFDSYIEIIRPFSNSENIMYNNEIIEIKYNIGSSKSEPYFKMKFKNQKKVMFICDDREEAAKLIKIYIKYDFPIILNSIAIRQLIQFGIKVNNKGVVIEG